MHAYEIDRAKTNGVTWATLVMRVQSELAITCPFGSHLLIYTDTCLYLKDPLFYVYDSILSIKEILRPPCPSFTFERWRGWGVGEGAAVTQANGRKRQESFI